MEEMLTIKQLAVILGVSSRTLDNWRAACRGPAYFRFEGTIRYRMSDVEAWLKGWRVQTIEAVRLCR